MFFAHPYRHLRFIDLLQFLVSLHLIACTTARGSPSPPQEPVMQAIT